MASLSKWSFLSSGERLKRQGGTLPKPYLTGFSGPVSSEESDCRTHYKHNGDHREEDSCCSGTSLCHIDSCDRGNQKNEERPQHSNEQDFHLLTVILGAISDQFLHTTLASAGEGPNSQRLRDLYLRPSLKPGDVKNAPKQSIFYLSFWPRPDLGRPMLDAASLLLLASGP
jgi:hypothetical protein